MIYPAIKEYLHSTTISKKELTFIKSLLEQSGGTLGELLPTEINERTFFLADILQTSLKDYKNNQKLVEDVLSFKDEHNQENFYECLRQSKDGRELLKVTFNQDKNKLFKEFLLKEKLPNIIEFVQANKEELDIKCIYSFPQIDLNLVLALEKEGFQFNQKIVPIVNNKINYDAPSSLLKFMNRFKDKVDNKVWDIGIIKMLTHYNNVAARWDAKYIFKDRAFLITQLKEPSNYKWGRSYPNSPTESISHSSLSISHALSCYIREETIKDKYIDPKNKKNFKLLKEFVKNNDIYFYSLKKEFITFNFFIDDMSNSVLEDAVKKDWPKMFKFESDLDAEYMVNVEPIFPFIHEIEKYPIFKNERFRAIVLKQYFTQTQYRLDEFGEKYFFTGLGITEQSVKEEKVLLKYTNILSLDDITYIAKKLDLDFQPLHREYLDSILPDSNNNEIKKKPKI